MSIKSLVDSTADTTRDMGRFKLGLIVYRSSPLIRRTGISNFSVTVLALSK
jgi:hypothetical protein